MRKNVEVELNFHGDGYIRCIGQGSFSGGVANPQVKGELSFSVRRQVSDEDGILNPVEGEGTVEGSFQINLWGTSAGYRELGRYFIALAELDTSVNPGGYHDHFDELQSSDQRTHIHLITRKDA